MKKIMILSVGLLLSTQLFAADVDLKATMKQMKLAFKQAADAQTVQDMQAPITELTQLVDNAKHAELPPEKKDVYLEGFNKLTVTLDKIDSELKAGEFEAAKQSLTEVDNLRKEYHAKRKTSLWDRIFG